MNYEHIEWQNSNSATGISFQCGYCGNKAGPSIRFPAKGKRDVIYICPTCSQPTYFDSKQEQTPKPRLGDEISGINKPNVALLYNEARDCTSVGAYTAAVMACRKILMNLAVDQKAEEGKQFAYYVDYLKDNGFVPPQGKEWVKAIKDRGNDANHQIVPMDEEDATLILHFTGALLRFNYELPSVLEADTKKRTPLSGTEGSTENPSK